MGTRYNYEDYPDFEDNSLYNLEWRENHFVAKLCDVLPDVCFDYFPELGKHRDLLLPDLIKHALTVGEDANHYFMVINYQVKSDLSFPITPITKRRTEGDLQRDIDNFFANSTGEINCKHSVIKDLRRIHDEFNFKAEFKFRLHNKLKEVMVENYPQIFNFNSYGFRQMDSWLYWECVERVFYKEFMSITDKLLDDRYPEFEFEYDPEFLEKEEQALFGTQEKSEND